jgi:endonuclease-3
MLMKRPAAAVKSTSRVKEIINHLEKLHPDAKLALNYQTPLELLIALILAAQARDALVNEITANLFKTYRSAQDYAAVSTTKLEEQIKKINFYRNKAKSIHNCCKEIAARFGGNVPQTLDELLTLPGVGRKTANIVLGNAFGQPAIGVDTHVMRLAQRLGLTKDTNPDKIEFDLTAIVPRQQRVRFCHLLQYHGRQICMAKQPRCPQCAISRLCPYPDKTEP